MPFHPWRLNWSCRVCLDKLQRLICIVMVTHPKRLWSLLADMAGVAILAMRTELLGQMASIMCSDIWVLPNQLSQGVHPSAIKHCMQRVACRVMARAMWFSDVDWHSFYLVSVVLMTCSYHFCRMRRGRVVCDADTCYLPGVVQIVCTVA
jgi:hypothetical protein